MKKAQEKIFPAEFEIYSTDLNSLEKFNKQYWIYAKIITIKDLNDKLLIIFKSRQEIIMNLYLKKSLEEIMPIFTANKIYQI